MINNNIGKDRTNVNEVKEEYMKYNKVIRDPFNMFNNNIQKEEHIDNNVNKQQIPLKIGVPNLNQVQDSLDILMNVSMENNNILQTYKNEISEKKMIKTQFFNSQIKKRIRYK